METNLILLIGFFGLLYSFSDAWHDNKVIEGNKRWHSIDAFIKLIVSGVIGGIVYYYSKDYYLSFSVIALIILIRASTFNIFLNLFMGWEFWYHRKKGIDKIPIWVWWILLAGLIVFLFTSCETNAPIKGTNIDFIEQTKVASMPEHSHVLIPELEKQIIVNDIWEGFEVAWKESKTAEGIYVDKGTIIVFEVRKLNGVLIDER